MAFDLCEERPELAELLPLYEAVGWTAYTREPELLERAVRSSTWVLTARAGGLLVGLVRCVSDDATICYLQDILVRPTHHRLGIGHALATRALERFAHVRQLVLLTDDRPEQTAFYESLGLVRIDKATTATLRAFARILGLS